MYRRRLPGILNIIIFFLFLYQILPAQEGQNSVRQDLMASTGKFGPPNQVCAGVNIHFIAGHEADLDMIAAGGFKYIRMDFIWQLTEPRKGIYDWTEYDELTSNLRKRGLSAIYILDYSNSNYEDSVSFKDPITGEEYKDIASPQHPESVEAYSRWAAAAVEHFRDSQITWEIWNEPNVTFWRPVPDVNQYISLAMAACKAIKDAVPGAVIIGPATSQIPFPFIETFLGSGVLGYLDGVSVHPYRDYSKSPETAAEDYNKLREIIHRYTPARKEEVPVISSEWGYASATKGISTGTQAAYIVRMQLSNLLNKIPVSIWYDWKNDGDVPTNFEHNCGTVTSGLKPKPAYIAATTMNEQLNGFTLMHRIKSGDENDYFLLFRNGKGVYKLAAWSVEQSHSVALGEILPGITKIEGVDWKGDKINPEGNKSTSVIMLTGQPQYIILPSGFQALPPAP